MIEKANADKAIIINPIAPPQRLASMGSSRKVLIFSSEPNLLRFDLLYTHVAKKKSGAVALLDHMTH